MKKKTVKNISDFLNSTLRVKKIRDTSVNGLQVRARNAREIAKVGFAVDACISTFEKAKEQGVELLVVHHGIKWRPQKDKVLAEKRTAFLERSDMALYAVHLPLDLHEEYGNNMQLARFLELGRLRRFGRYHGIKIGYAGTFRTATSPKAVAMQVRSQLRSACRVFPFGKDRIRSIGIISGGGGGMVNDVVKEKLDCFLVGEIDLAVYNAASDHGISLIVAGHYATETVGVKALMPLIGETFGLETVFIEDKKKL
jgi:dinuclear metal center YbgI/SA1388 family protein